MSEPRQYSEEEVRQQFLEHISYLVKYWGRQEGPVHSKLEGLAFLVAIDGAAGGLPAFILAPYPHPTDKAYHLEEGENYYAENHEANVQCDIAGQLHDLFYTVHK